jgi:hypothetical protein
MPLEPIGQLKFSAPKFATNRFPDGRSKTVYDPSPTRSIRSKPSILALDTLGSEICPYPIQPETQLISKTSIPRGHMSRRTMNILLEAAELFLLLSVPRFTLDGSMTPRSGQQMGGQLLRAPEFREPFIVFRPPSEALHPDMLLDIFDEWLCPS